MLLQLPSGSYYPEQPPIRVEITLQVSSFADPGTPLPIKVMGGFQFGSSATGTGCLEGAAAMATTVPTLFKVRKLYLGPESETTTGPNFPRPYRIEVDVADGQILDPLLITEDLPDSLVYLGPYGPPVVSAPPPGIPNGQVVLDFGKVTGTASDTDASFEFEFYAGAEDASGNPVLDPTTCKGLAVDDVVGKAEWDPLDPRDTPVPVTSDVTPQDHVLELECLSVQKRVIPPGPHIPGDELVYRLDFQVSDYVQTGDVAVTDVLADGLLSLNQPAPTLTFTDKNGIVQGTFTLGTDAIADDRAKNPCGNGSTVVRFDISTALAALTATDPGANPLHQAGVLTGGEVGTVSPSVAATGTITYHVRIADEFDCPVPSRDQSVDKHDRLTNSAAIAGAVLELAGEPGTVTAEDDTNVVVVEIAHGLVDKSIVARNGNPNDPLLQRSPPLFAPGDTVTFRLSYCFPSTDAEEFRLEDFLPAPFFDATQVTGVTRGPNDELGTFLGSGPLPCPDAQGGDPAPPGFADAARNSVCFFFGSFDDPANRPRCVEVLFTVPLTAQPFADGLLPINEVHESEQSSFNERFDQTRIQQVALGQPVVRVSKGAVSACCHHPEFFLCIDPVGTFAPAVTGPVAFSGPVLSCGVRFTPPLTSAMLAATPVQSDVVGGVDAGDRILFALIVENTGSSPQGAFDVRIKENLPAGLAIPPRLEGGDLLCVEDGAGNPLLYNLLPGGLFGSGIELVDPGPTQGALAPGPGNTTGSNLAVITYALDVDQPLAIGACAANRAAVASYAGTEGGQSHVAAGLGGPLQQSAQVCRKPALVKSIVATSETHTQPKNGAEELTLGEIVRFRLVLEVPKGTMSGLRIEDELPGLSILPETVRLAFVSSQGTGLTASALTAGSGLAVAGNETTVASVTPTFDPPSTVNQSRQRILNILLGDLTNSETDCDREFVVIEFNALVVNEFFNNSGQEPVNTAVFGWDGQLLASNPVKLRIVEPRLRINKAMREHLDNPFGRAVILSIANVGTSDAFDIVVTDELPESLCLQAGTSVMVQPEDGATVTVVGKKVEVKIDRIPLDGTVDIVFQVLLCGEVSCESTLNVADVTWTSLPGPNGTVNNPTGSATPGASGVAEGERNGNGGSVNGSAVNTYHDQDLYNDFADCLPDLTVTKVCDQASSIVCTIVVTNMGPGEATSVTLNDVLPPGTEILPLVPPMGKGWSCSGSGPISCTYNDPLVLPLTPGEKTAELVVRIKRGPAGQGLDGQNCARVIITGEGDGNPANNIDCFGACPRFSEASYFATYPPFPLEGAADPCAQFPLDDCLDRGPAFKGDCGCGCLDDPHPPPDIAVTKTCPDKGPGVCQIAVQNVGQDPAVGTLTITDTLLSGVTLLAPGISGINWRCNVTAGKPKLVTCTWEGPPLAPGQTAPPLLLPLGPRPGAEFLPKNCARAALVGDVNEENDLGCTKPPRCLDLSFVNYISEDPSVCARISFDCNGCDIRFSNDCGCGCIDWPFGPWC